MRTLVDIPDEDIKSLDVLATKSKRSRASAIREAVKLYLVQNSNKDWIDDAFGLWSDRKIDGLEYQRKVRAEWDRDWDTD